MLKVNRRDSDRLRPTQLSADDFSEDDLREWLIQNPDEILGEHILIIGREVNVADIRDGIDILGLDRQGNLVVVELKRGAHSGSVDIQILKYASYVSRWNYSDIKQQFEMFLETEWGRALYDGDASFTDILDDFCDNDYEVNTHQRLFLVGENVRERIGSVVLWLRENGINASVIEVTLFLDEDGDCFVDAKTIVPTSDLAKFETGERPVEEPWNVEGRRWHLEERAGEETAHLIRTLVELFEEDETLAGPNWGQKFYISFRKEGTNRVILRTRTNLIWLEIYDIPLAEDGEQIVDHLTKLGVDEDDIQIDPEYRGRIKIRCRPEDDVEYDRLVDYIRELLGE